MLIGYARVSTRRQRLDLQHRALEAARCDLIISEWRSGDSGIGHGLGAAMECCGAGDLLVVWKLDRLGRNVMELMGVIERLRRRGAGLKVLTGAASAIDINAAEGQALFAIYAEQLGEHAGLPFDLIMPDSETRSNHHIAGLMMRDADAARRLMAFLAARDIQAMSHYKPLHLSGEGRRLGVARHALPQAEAAWRRLVRLPLHTAMNADDAHRVAGAVRAWAGRGTDKPGPRPGKVQAASARSRMEASA